MEQTINTGGGSAVAGNVDTQGGDFVGRDKIIYQSLLVTISPSPEPERPPQTMGFVGRKQELAYYRHQLKTTNFALITGMAGVGKTMLAAKLTQQFAQKRIFWHSFHDQETLDVIIWKLAGFLAHHGHSTLWEQLETARQRNQQLPPFEILLDLILALLTGGDYLCCFDNFHFVNGDHRLKYLVMRLQKELVQGHLSILITARRAPPFAPTVAAQALPGLTQEDVQKLLRGRKVDLNSELVAILHQDTGGNAALIHLAINALQHAENPALLIKSLTETDDIERYLLNQVDQGLTAEQKLVMVAIAIFLDYPAKRQAIAAILPDDFTKSRLADILLELSDAHLLHVRHSQRGQREYGQHGLLQAFYATRQDEPQRRTMHRRAGDFYAADTAERDLLRAATHYQAAGEYEAAALLLSEDIVNQLYTGQAQRVLALLNSFTPKQLSAKTWIKLGIAKGTYYFYHHDLAQSSRCYEQALRSAEQAGDDLNVLAICINLANLKQTTGAWQEAGAYYDRAITVADELGNLEERANVNLNAGALYLAQGKHAQAEQSLSLGGKNKLPGQITCRGFQ